MMNRRTLRSFLALVLFLAACGGGGGGGGSSTTEAEVTTVAGTAGSFGTDDGAGSAARFKNPRGATASLDNQFLFVADSNNHTVRKMEVATGVVTTLAGEAGVAWDGDPATYDGTGSAAHFNRTEGLAADDTHVYVVDSFNHAIRKVEIATGAVTTVAGEAGVPWDGDPATYDGTGSAAHFSRPRNLAIIGGDLYVTDGNNHTVRKVEIATGVVTTVAGEAGVEWDGDLANYDGTGTAAHFSTPRGVTPSADNLSLFIADSGAGTIRKFVIASGVVTTVAGQPGETGSANGTGAAARFSGLSGLDRLGGFLYVGDTDNELIRKVEISTGVVTTVAGSAGVIGTADGPGSAARFSAPYQVVASGGNVYVCDSDNHAIRKVELP